MRVKLIASMLVLAVAALFGAAPCAWMSMEMEARGMGDSCASAPHNQMVGEASTPMPSSPADCCVIGSEPVSQTPGARAGGATSMAISMPDVLPDAPWLAAPEPPRGWTASTGPPRPAASIPLHLLLSVLLI